MEWDGARGGGAGKLTFRTVRKKEEEQQRRSGNCLKNFFSSPQRYKGDKININTKVKQRALERVEGRGGNRNICG